jgi:membrane-bound metal-dependent hydrolase YbcI (DUF457 family)
MFVGHFAVGLAAKPLAPRVSLAILILAATLADVLWIVFLVTGLERVEITPGLMAANSLNLVSVPFSHSLLMDAVWGLLCAGIYFLARHDSRGAWVIAAAVVSHWVLDVVTHRPDMQLLPWVDTRVGLGLWNSPAATLLVEGLLWFTAIVLYVRATRAKGRAGRHGFWPMIVVLTALWLVSLRGDPPPSLGALARVNTVFFAIVLAWAAWMNRARAVVTQRNSA